MHLLSRLHQEKQQNHQIQNQKRQIFLHIQGRQTQCHPSHRDRIGQRCRKNRNQKEKNSRKES